MIEQIREVMTPEQAADYLQVNRETVYRYIREGKLVASRLGRAYRLPKRCGSHARARRLLCVSTLGLKSLASWKQIRWMKRHKRVLAVSSPPIHDC